MFLLYPNMHPRFTIFTKFTAAAAKYFGWYISEIRKLNLSRPFLQQPGAEVVATIRQ